MLKLINHSNETAFTAQRYLSEALLYESLCTLDVVAVFSIGISSRFNRAMYSNCGALLKSSCCLNLQIHLNIKFSSEEAHYRCVIVLLSTFDKHMLQ